MALRCRGPWMAPIQSSMMIGVSDAARRCLSAVSGGRRLLAASSLMTIDHNQLSESNLARTSTLPRQVSAVYQAGRPRRIAK